MCLLWMEIRDKEFSIVSSMKRCALHIIYTVTHTGVEKIFSHFLAYMYRYKTELCLSVYQHPIHPPLHLFSYFSYSALIRRIYEIAWVGLFFIPFSMVLHFLLFSLFLVLPWSRLVQGEYAIGLRAKIREFQRQAHAQRKINPQLLRFRLECV